MIPNTSIGANKMTAFDQAWAVVKEYSREEAEADILNSPFSEGLGWIDENGLTEAGKDVAAQYPAEDEKKSDDELEPCWSCDKRVVNEANAVGQVDEGDYAPYICPECGKKPENAEHLWDRGE